ncbi:PREDICTED: uncharacterized protein LOC109477126 [Branchiostoma belcheri]|uniref:Uncharacterized protein LOC109477126 n=1 Tax=Branchiostoma belcheri TaxID=7741 RepID=A0A6P4ZIA6_BRABE|nr:PREDICTED: uncharacterized protein LOC109477126 [Branchiostoma belcheri]
MAYNGRYIQGLGWALVILGSLSIVLGSVADAIFSTMQVLTFFHYSSGPIWSGVFVVVTGILGIFSGKHANNKCLISAFLVLAIFSILSTATCIGLAGIGIILDGNYCYTYIYDDQGRYIRDYCTTESTALHGVAILLAAAELVMSFVASIMSCCGLATPSSNTSPMVIYTSAAPGTAVQASQGGYIIMHTGVPVTATTGVTSQWSQQPHAAGVPMQVYSSTYVPQVHGAAQGPPPAPGALESKTPA